MSVCRRRARPVLALCPPCARPLLGVSAVPAASNDGCPLRLVKFMTFKFYSPSLSQCISLSHSLLLLLCVSRAIPGEISGRTHTANILRFLRFFFGVFIAALSLSPFPSRSRNAYRNKVNDYVGHQHFKRVPHSFQGSQPSPAQSLAAGHHANFVADFKQCKRCKLKRIYKAA